MTTDRLHSLVRLCQQYRIDILYAFGSRANEIREWLGGERASLVAGPTDADIGIKVVRPLSVEEKVNLAQAMEDLLGVTRVDLVTLSDADPFLAANIVRSICRTSSGLPGRTGIG
jgi:predicted nucleotidyltransferase